MGFVYIITCTKSPKVYIGVTIRAVEQRWYAHCKSVERGYKNKFANAVRKYGSDSFQIKPVFKSNSLRELFDKEKQLIQEMDSIENGWNTTKGGEGGSAKGRKFSAEHRQRISVSNKGKHSGSQQRQQHKDTRKAYKPLEKIECPQCGKLLVQGRMPYHLECHAAGRINGNDFSTISSGTQGCYNSIYDKQ